MLHNHAQATLPSIGSAKETLTAEPPPALAGPLIGGDSPIVAKLGAKTAVDVDALLAEYRELLRPGAPADDASVERLREVAGKLGRDVDRIRKDAGIVARAIELHDSIQPLLPARAKAKVRGLEINKELEAIDSQIRELQAQRGRLVGEVLGTTNINSDVRRARAELMQLHKAHGRLIDPALIPEL